MQSISVILPVYNEEDNIAYVLDRIAKFLPSVNGDFQIIVVDDGSTDRTSGILSSLIAGNTRLKVIHHLKNKGYGAALRSGFGEAQKELTLVMDADRQFEISELNKLLPYANDFDIVAGYRVKREDPGYRSFLGYCFNLLMKIAFGINQKDINCGFKLYKTGQVKKLKLTARGALINVQIMRLAAKYKLRVKQVEVAHGKRVYGEPTGGSFRVIARAVAETLTFIFDKPE